MNPIVSMCGSEEEHRDLSQALAWNDHERFGVGFFAQTKPPVNTADLRARIQQERTRLERERVEIVSLSNGTAKP